MHIIVVTFEKKEPTKHLVQIKQAATGINLIDGFGYQSTDLLIDAKTRSIIQKSDILSEKLDENDAVFLINMVRVQ